jgi:hypothetical protein
MMRADTLLVTLCLVLGGCASSPVPSGPDLGAIAIVASPYEPAAQFDPDSKAGNNAGAVIGAAGGAGIGALSAQASAGLLCTVGGPLCLIVMIPAAIVGGLLGGVTGGVVDAVTADPGNRIANAKAAIEETVAEMRLTDAVAAQTHLRASETRGPVILLKEKETDYRALAAKGITAALEVEAIDLQFLAREKEMALALRARSRLYRTSDGELLDERVSQAQTDFRKYQDWAADEAQPLRRAVDAAVAELGRSIVSEQLGSRPRADISARPGG